MVKILKNVSGDHSREDFKKKCRFNFRFRKLNLHLTDKLNIKEGSNYCNKISFRIWTKPLLVFKRQ